jgi:hypothetical protein
LVGLFCCIPDFSIFEEVNYAIVLNVMPYFHLWDKKVEDKHAQDILLSEV